jgi:poly(A) polymerase/tRNA nucleotidyltransferase (CCA-adding enzyme)
MTDRPVLILSPPPDFLSDPALTAVLDALPAARIVGGAVRDALAGRPVADIDLATPDRPEAVTAALTGAGLRAEPTGLAHGTVTAVALGRGFEVTTLRLDVETDGRHAVVAFTTDWRADAARRDFTFNAMSMDRAGQVFDYFGGIADLRAGITRFVGDPATRIAEDYLRILRFFRFQARYGARPPDAATEAAIRAGVARLGGLSAERVWSELRRILAAPDPVTAIHLMAAFGVLAAVMPEGASPHRLERLVGRGAPADPVLRLAALLDGDATTLAERLKLSNAERDRLIGVRAGPVPVGGATDADLRRLLADTPNAMLIDRVWLADDGRPGWPDLRERLSRMDRPVFPLVGRDVLALGVPPGPEVGRLLAAVRAWWLQGGCIADRAACLDHLRHARAAALGG